MGVQLLNNLFKVSSSFHRFHLILTLNCKFMEDKDIIHFSLFGLNFTVHKKQYFSLVLKVWLALCVILLVSVLLLDYEMTDADIPGGLISGALLAYLLHILIDQ